jgi:hypothetical protein
MRIRIFRFTSEFRILLPVVLLILWDFSRPAAAQTIFPVQPNVVEGGRAVALAVDRYGAISASESGGLYVTKDGGSTWTHIDSLPVFRMSDVEFAQDGVPGTQIIIATAYSDSRSRNLGGIWRSTDGGAHWSKPAMSNPSSTAGICPRANAWGIAVEPHSNNVYVGTDCGLAISPNSGASWRYTAPPRKPGSNSDRITAVVAQSGGIVDVCGDAGHYRYTASGNSWTAPSNALSGCPFRAVHAIAASPLEPNVLFATTANDVLMESDDGGSTWTSLNPPAPGYFGREAWVKAHPSTDGNADHFDLYFGNPTNVAHRTCSNRGGPGIRCTGSWIGSSLDHFDTNDLAFGMSSDNCPQFLATDGGVHKTSDCGANWHLTGGGTGGYNALQIYEVTGQIHPDHVDEYFGTQDNNLWGSGDNGTTWPNSVSAEGFHIQVMRSSPSHTGQIVTGTKCPPPPRRPPPLARPVKCGSFKSEAHFVNSTAWNDPGQPACCNPFVVDFGVYFQFSQPDPPATELFLTTNSGGRWDVIKQANGMPLTISQSGAGSPRLSGPPSAPVIYTAVRKAGLSSGGDEIVGLIKITGARGGGAAVSPADNNLSNIGQYCTGQGSFICDPTWGVDPNNPQNLIAADIGNGAMMVSHDGGGSWQADTRLTDLVTWGGTFLFNVTQTSQPWREGVAVQAHAIGFDPDDSDHILVGTEAAGIIESLDGGRTWNTIPASDSFIQGVTNFFFEQNHTVLIATYGRGLWKLRPLKLPPPVLCRDQLGNPMDCRTKFVDPRTGSLLYPHEHWGCPQPPEPPTCQFIQPSIDNFRDIAIDKEGNIKSLWINAQTLRGYDVNGKAVPVNLPVRRSGKYGTFAGCRECNRVLKEGGMIQGIVISKGHLLALIAQYRKPQLAPRTGVAGAKLAAAGAPLQQPGTQPYLQLVGTVPITGEAVALMGDSVSVYGSGYCPEQRCGPVTLRVADRVVTSALKVEGNGTFHLSVKITEVPGVYLVTATQKEVKRELKDGKWLIVGISDK